MDEKVLYRLNDRISFRRCSLADGMRVSYGDCTNFDTKEQNWTTYYGFNQDGLHFHCTQHPEIELTRKVDGVGTVYYSCSRCNPAMFEIENEHALRSECLRMLNIPAFKGAKLIRLDDWYVHEVREKKKDESGYWITTDVKTDKDGNTIIVLYVGHKDSKEKLSFSLSLKKASLQATTRIWIPQMYCQR